MIKAGKRPFDLKMRIVLKHSSLLSNFPASVAYQVS
jgi:hypothetical protein